MTHVFGYVRRSSDRQEELLEQQRAKLEAYAKFKGWSSRRFTQTMQSVAVNFIDLALTS
ncbi:MAG: recombinase family protein [Phycisphaeraceae bacterium JB051]